MRNPNKSEFSKGNWRFGPEPGLSSPPSLSLPIFGHDFTVSNLNQASVTRLDLNQAAVSRLGLEASLCLLSEPSC